MEKNIQFEYVQALALLRKAKSKESAPWRLAINTFEDLSDDCIELYSYFELGHVPFFMTAHCYHAKSLVPAVTFSMGPNGYQIEYGCFRNAGHERMEAFSFLKHCTFYKDSTFGQRKSEDMNDILIEFLHASLLLFSKKPKFVIK